MTKKKLTIRRERPSQRLHHRVSAPLSITIDGTLYDAADWSLGGFRIEGLTNSTLKSDDVISVGLNIPFQGFDINFNAQAKVLRLTDEGILSCHFLDLDERSEELLRHFIDEIVQGNMTTTADTLQRIDTPVTPVPTTPETNKASDVPISRWSIKTIAMTSFYLTAGLSIFIYIGSVLYVNFYKLQVESAVVAAPIESVHANITGRVEQISSQLNKLVERDTPIIRLNDAKIEVAINLARVSIRRSEADIEFYQHSLMAEQDKMTDYEAIAEDRIAMVQRDVESLRIRLKMAKRNTARLKVGVEKGFAAKTHYEFAIAEEALLHGELDRALLQLEQNADVFTRISYGRYFNGIKLEGETDQLIIEEGRAIRKTDIAKMELAARLTQKDSLTLRAPTAGRLVKLFVSNGSTVEQGQEIALFERDENRHIEVFLTQEEVLQVGMGGVAIVFFPSLEMEVNAHITAIDRTSGFIDEQTSQYNWRGSEDRSARLTLEFSGVSPDFIRSRIPSGLPAIVIFDRQQTTVSFFKISKQIEGFLNTIFGEPDDGLEL